MTTRYAGIDALSFLNRLSPSGWSNQSRGFRRWISFACPDSSRGRGRHDRCNREYQAAHAIRCLSEFSQGRPLISANLKKVGASEIFKMVRFVFLFIAIFVSSLVKVCRSLRMDNAMPENTPVRRCTASVEHTVTL